MPKQYDPNANYFLAVIEEQSGESVNHTQFIIESKDLAGARREARKYARHWWDVDHLEKDGWYRVNGVTRARVGSVEPITPIEFFERNM